MEVRRHRDAVAPDRSSDSWCTSTTCWSTTHRLDVGLRLYTPQTFICLSMLSLCSLFFFSLSAITYTAARLPWGGPGMIYYCLAWLVQIPEITPKCISSYSSSDVFQLGPSHVQRRSESFRRPGRAKNSPLLRHFINVFTKNVPFNFYRASVQWRAILI